MSLPTPHLPPRRDRRTARTVGALSASVIAFPLVGGSAQAATIPFPKPTKPLPSALDVVTPYEKGTLCLTETQPGVIAFAKLLNATYGTHTYGTLRQCAAEHGEGRALDWMLSAGDPTQLALGNALTRWLSAPDSEGRPGAMARRFGINYIIWNRQQWYAWDPATDWRPYYGSSPHTDHIHFSFTWDGACERTSWWTGTALTRYTAGPLSTATPCAPSSTSTGYPYLVQGASGSDVVTLQKVIGAEPDGKFGPLTAAALGTWQSQHGLTATKAADEATWSAMISLGLVPSRTGGTGSTTSSGSTSSGSTSSGSTSSGSTSSGSASTGTTSPLAQYATQTLRVGSRGAAVSAMQKAIGGLVVDGVFGPLTEARVKAYQKSKGLAQTGVVDAKVWAALMGTATGSSTATSGAGSSTSTGTSGTGGSSTSGGTSTTTSSPLAKYAGLTLKMWSRGEAVAAMQKAVGGLVADGVFGPLTQARVLAYQKSKGLAQTGVVDAKMWAALMAPSASASAGSPTTAGSPAGSTSGTTGSPAPSSSASGSVATSGSSTPSGSSAAGAATVSTTTEFTALKATTLRRGATGTAVRTLQRALGGLAVDGVFGPLTEGRVRSFQSSARLSATGVVDRATWDALERRVHPTLPYWNVVLKRGSTGAAVKALQSALGGLAVDGVFGPLTEARVKAAQKDARLAQTGVVATLTWKAVDAR